MHKPLFFKNNYKQGLGQVYWDLPRCELRFRCARQGRLVSRGRALRQHG